MMHFLILFYFILFFTISLLPLKIVSLNINGLNDRKKQVQLVNHINYRKIDILFIQEHNLRETKFLCNELLDCCEIFINLSINQKGGTATLINKRLHYTVLSNEMSADSRIISTRIKHYNTKLHLVNVYAPASVNFNERDRFFQNDLLFYLRNNINNIVLGGDWNCILTERDCQSKNIQVSKSLLNIIRSIKCKDAWFSKHRNIEYTFVRQNYGSRIDRFYIKDFANYIEYINVIHINFSDHSSVEMSIKIPEIPKIGKFYWKLNASMLDREDIKNDFRTEWNRIKSSISFYDSINDWWELHAKSEIKKFFMYKGREEMQRNMVC